MNNLENENILPKKILDAIFLIIDKCPDVVFGGSIALNAVGLINRKISDIDMFFPTFDSLTKNGFFDVHGNELELSETVTDVNGVLVQRVGTKINDVKCCVFKVTELELQSSKIKLFGRTIRIQNVNFAIMAKMSYAKSTKKETIISSNVKKEHHSTFSGGDDIIEVNKHVSDLEQITKTLDDLFVDDDGNIVW